MINRMQRISLWVASAAAVVLVATLFLPWMGFTHGGDISKSASGFVSGGGLTRPLTDQTAFQLSGLAAAIMILAAIAAVLIALWTGLGMGLIERRTTGLVVTAVGVVGLATTAALVFGVQSDPLDFGGGASDPVLLDWGALIGAQLATLASVVILGAGAAFLVAARDGATSPERAPASAA
jgi:hypothetical protein